MKNQNISGGNNFAAKLILFALVMAVVVTAYLILRSFAATNPISVEAELGSSQLAQPGGAASNGQFIEFKGNSTSNGKFTVQGPKIVGPNGAGFLPVGSNNPAGSHNTEGFFKGKNMNNITQADIDVLKNKWKINTIRVNIHPQHKTNGDIFTDPTLHSVLDKLSANKIVSIVENHAYGTGNDPTNQQIQAIATGFGKLSNKYKNNPYVWYNPFNEPGGKRNASVYSFDSKSTVGKNNWKNWHTPVIEAIRANTDSIIVIDETHWGQGKVSTNFTKNESAVLTHGPSLKNQYSNLVFSVHMYDNWGGGDIKQNMRDYFNEGKNLGLAQIVGEIGGHPSLYLAPHGPAIYQVSKSFFELRLPAVGVTTWTANSSYRNGFSHARNFGGGEFEATPIWKITQRSDTEGTGPFLWDYSNNKPSANR